MKITCQKLCWNKSTMLTGNGFSMENIRYIYVGSLKHLLDYGNFILKSNKGSVIM